MTEIQPKKVQNNFGTCFFFFFFTAKKQCRCLSGHCQLILDLFLIFGSRYAKQKCSIAPTNHETVENVWLRRLLTHSIR